MKNLSKKLKNLLSLFVPVLGSLLFSGPLAATTLLTIPPTLYCTHAQVCNLLNDLADPQFKIQLTTPVKGDPHLYDPGPSEIKKLVTVPNLYTAPVDLQPWLVKIIELRKAKNPPTFVPTLPPEIIKLYHSHDQHSLSHFWLYPDLLCSLKNQFFKNIPRASTAKSLPNCNFSFDQDLKNSKLNKSTWFILTHDALAPLLEKYGFHVLSLKGSGDHEEVGPSGIKQIQKLLQFASPRPPIIWILETDHPESTLWAKNLIKDKDQVIEIRSEGSFPNPSDQVLIELTAKLKKLTGKK